MSSRIYASVVASAVALAPLVTPLQADESDIHSVMVGAPISIPNNAGDTWVPAWTRDGGLYSPSNDTKGFFNAGTGNLMFNQLLGDTPASVTGTTVNVMSDYGASVQKKADGCTWKSSGCIAVDGALYWVIARHKYGETSGDENKRQPAHNACIIKSIDHGKTWTPSEEENYEYPQFPGSRFAAAYFVDYGQDGHETFVDNADRYVYALSNNGFWDNGDNLVLGRVERSKIGSLNPKYWQFYKGGDGLLETSWSAKQGDAKYVIDSPNTMGSSGAVYLAAKKCYFMVSWHYPAGGGKMPDAHKETQWDFWVAQHPWGPWRKVGSHTFCPQGYYCPTVCLRLTQRIIRPSL